jgi:hypothetical protein
LLGKGGGFLEDTQTLKSIKDMEQNELVEALPRLREEAVKAEAALRVAQDRVHEANGRMVEVLSFVEVHDDKIVVDCRGRDKVLRSLGRVSIPLEHVVRSEADPKVEWAVWRGWRVPGVRVPGVRFYDMHGRRDKTLVIWLKDKTYDRLITEVEDPVEVAEKINEAVAAPSRS